MLSVSATRGLSNTTSPADTNTPPDSDLHIDHPVRTPKTLSAVSREISLQNSTPYQLATPSPSSRTDNSFKHDSPPDPSPHFPSTKAHDTTERSDETPSPAQAYSCKACHKTYDTLRKLRKHDNQTHNLKYACDVPGCSASFGIKGGLIRHQGAQHPDLHPPAGLRCPLCDTVVRGRRDNLTRHLRRRHAMEKKEARETAPVAMT